MPGRVTRQVLRPDTLRNYPSKTIERIRRRDWAIGLCAALVALAALVVGSNYGSLHGARHLKVIAWGCAGVVLVSGVLATSRLAATASRVVAGRSAEAAGGAVKVLATVTGYLFTIFSVLALLKVEIEHLLVGAGLAGVVLGIAAQQSLGNVFAGLVLLVARPFEVGDDIRVRAGALGGIFDAQVREMSLTYVTLLTDDGNLKVPNSVMLAAGVAQRSSMTPASSGGSPAPPSSAPTSSALQSTQLPGSAGSANAVATPPGGNG